jgi:hypothetical protein
MQSYLFDVFHSLKTKERFSPKDAPLDEKSNSGSNHILGFMGYGVDDFISKENEGLLD